MPEQNEPPFDSPIEDPPTSVDEAWSVLARYRMQVTPRIVRDAIGLLLAARGRIEADRAEH